MLNRAFKKFRNLQGLIMHSDQGWQYQHEYYRSELKSMELYSQCRVRATAMTTVLWRPFWSDENEMYYGSEKEYTSFKVFAKAVKEYIHYFNKERIQKKQNGCLPKYIGKHPLMPFN